MKRLLALVLVALLVVSVTYAGDTVTPRNKAGNKALLFNFGGLGALAAGEYAGGLGAKYYFSNGLAGRVSIDFNTSSSTENNPTPSPQRPAGQSEEREQSSMGYRIAPGVLYTIATTGAVNAYVGAQILFVGTSTSADGQGGTGFDSDSKVETTTMDFGGGAILGVEWFPWENISFGAEYTLSFLSGSGDTERTTDGSSTTTDAPSTSSFAISAANDVTLTLSVYF